MGGGGGNGYVQCYSHFSGGENGYIVSFPGGGEWLGGETTIGHRYKRNVQSRTLPFVFHGVRSRKLCSKLPSGIIAEVLERVFTTNEHVKLLHGFMDHDGFPPSYKRR